MNEDNKPDTCVMDRKTLLALIEDMAKGGWPTTLMVSGCGKGIRDGRRLSGWTPTPGQGFLP